MTNTDTDFETWFDILQMQLNDEGINFQDRDAVKDDYDRGDDLHDVVDSIVNEYKA